MCALTVEQIDELPALIDSKEAARITGLHLRTVQAMCRRGEISAKLVGERYLINTAKLLEMCGLGR